MGSLTSAVVDNLYMEFFEELALETAPHSKVDLTTCLRIPSFSVTVDTASLPTVFICLHFSYPDPEWVHLGKFQAANKREVQSFPLATDRYVYAKYIKVREQLSLPRPLCTRWGGEERMGEEGGGGGEGRGRGVLIGSPFGTSRNTR